jgi:hypothetical protein
MTSSFRSLVILAALTGGCANLGGDSVPTETDTNKPCYYDGDGDGAGGEPAGLHATCPTGTVTNGLDCDDNNPVEISCDDAYVEPVADPVWVQQVRQDGLVLLADGLACVDESHLNRPDLELGVFGYNLAGAQSASDWRRAAYTFYDHSMVADVRCVRLPVDRPLRLALAAIDESGSPAVWLNPSDRFSGYVELFLFTFHECDFLYGSTEPVQKVNLCLQYTDSIGTWSSPDGSCEALYVGPPECEGADGDHDDVDPPAAGTTWYRDADGDTYGTDSLTRVSVNQPVGYVARGGDCNDSQSGMWPGAPERLNGYDDDCDGRVDEDIAGDPLTYVYCYAGPDADGDGYAVGTVRTQYSGTVCPGGSYANGNDCNDGSAAANPGRTTEEYDGLDNDCDGMIDEGFVGQPAPGGARTTVTLEVTRDSSFSGTWTLWGWNSSAWAGHWPGMGGGGTCDSGTDTTQSCQIQVQDDDIVWINGERGAGVWIVENYFGTVTERIDTLRINGRVYSISTARNDSPAAGTCTVKTTAYDLVCRVDM